MANNQIDVNTTSEQINAQLVTLTEKYLANKQYVLSGTNTGYIGAEIVPLAPYANLSNRYYPTVATLPENSTNLKTKDQIGGYLLPSEIGASVYQAKNLTPLIDITKIEAGKIYNYPDPALYNKGRGLTKKDQDDIVIHIEDKDWMKSSRSDSFYDGQVINSDTYQKFIPYQSAFESIKLDDNGVITVKDDFEYWTGTEKDVWGADGKGSELNWIKYFDSKARTTNLILSENTELISWATDVYGNEYAVYKPRDESRTIYDTQNTINGTLWVKTADGVITNATEALSSIYKKYQFSDPTLYNALNQNKINHCQVFFDTLVISASGHRLYEKINFDYETAHITPYSTSFIATDFGSSVATKLVSSTSIPFNLNTTGYKYVGTMWFNEYTKKFVTCALVSAGVISTGAVSGAVIPLLYEYDINNPGTRTRIYPHNEADFSDYIYTASELASSDKAYLTRIENPLISYNKTTNTYFVSFVAYSDQYFKLINYTTNPAVIPNNVIVTEVLNPITDENGNYLAAQ